MRYRKRRAGKRCVGWGGKHLTDMFKTLIVCVCVCVCAEPEDEKERHEQGGDMMNAGWMERPVSGWLHNRPRLFPSAPLLFLPSILFIPLSLY